MGKLLLQMAVYSIFTRRLESPIGLAVLAAGHLASPTR